MVLTIGFTNSLNFISMVLRIGFTNSLNFIFLFDSIGVTTSSSSINKLFSQALTNSLQIPKTSLTCTSCKKVHSIIYPPEWTHIYSLTTNNTSSTDTCGILSRTRIDNSIDYDLDWVLIG